VLFKGAPPAKDSDQFGGLRLVVSHSSTIKLWMNGALRFLVMS
jgi:hypothetical protein